MILTRQQVTQPFLLHSHHNDVFTHHCEFHVSQKTSSSQRPKKQRTLLTFNFVSTGLSPSVNWAVAFRTKYKLLATFMTFLRYKNQIHVWTDLIILNIILQEITGKKSAINSALRFSFCAVSILSICVLVKTCKAATIHLRNGGFIV